MTLPENDASIKPFVGHLLDLRTTVIRVACFILAGIFIAVPFAPLILRWLKWPYYHVELDKVVDYIHSL